MPNSVMKNFEIKNVVVLFSIKRIFKNKKRNNFHKL